MSYKPADSYYGEFTTQNPTTGAITAATGTPVATATHNGVDDGTFALTVGSLATGRYKITGTIPAGYAAGDVVQISVSATVSGVAGGAVVDAFVLDGKRVADLSIPTAAQNATAHWQDTTGADFAVPLSAGAYLLAAGSAGNPLAQSLATFASGTYGWWLNRVVTGPVTIQSPLVAGGDIQLTRKDDNFSADGYGVLINDPGTWPNFTGGSAVVTIADDAYNVLVGPLAVTIINPAGPTKQILLQFSSLQLTIPASPALAPYRYDVLATLASGRRETVARGRFRLAQNITP